MMIGKRVKREPAQFGCFYGFYYYTVHTRLSSQYVVYIISGDHITVDKPFGKLNSLYYLIKNPAIN